MDQATMVLRAFILKTALPVVGGSLRDLFNKSLFTGNFPEEWKLVRIAPINKSGARDERSNYKPTLVYLFISTLCEKLFFNQFCEYLDANEIIIQASVWFSTRTLNCHSPYG